MIAGVQPTAQPPMGTPLAPADRAALGFTGPGVTMRYEGGLIADFGAETATIRITETDVANAMRVLDAAMQNAPGDTQQTEEAAAAGQKLRTYFIRLTERRYARVAVTYPEGGRAPLEFRVTGVASIGYASPGAAAA